MNSTRTTIRAHALARVKIQACRSRLAAKLSDWRTSLGFFVLFIFLFCVPESGTRNVEATSNEIEDFKGLKYARDFDTY